MLLFFIIPVCYLKNKIYIKLDETLLLNTSKKETICIMKNGLIQGILLNVVLLSQSCFVFVLTSFSIRSRFVCSYSSSQGWCQGKFLEGTKLPRESRGQRPLAVCWGGAPWRGSGGEAS